MVDVISDQKPDLVGIAVRSPLFPLFKSLSVMLRERMDVKILVSGHHPTADPESCKPFADYVYLGKESM